MVVVCSHVVVVSCVFVVAVDSVVVRGVDSGGDRDTPPTIELGDNYIIISP